MPGGELTIVVMEALLALQIGACDHAASCSMTNAQIARETVAEHPTKGQEACGWISVVVSPMTRAFAESLGMDGPYGAIFDQPEPDSPAAAAGIEQGDVLTQINGSSLLRAGDFANIISMMAAGTQIYFDTLRNGQTMQLTVILGSMPCRKSGWMRGRSASA